jgi:hypothetical protein
LLKFLLLERQRIPLQEVPRLLREIPLFADANERYLRQSAERLAQWTIGELVRAGAADVVDDVLMNKD